MARTKKAELRMPTKAQACEDIKCAYWACPHMRVEFRGDGGMDVRACGHPDRPKAGIDLLRWPYEFAPRECPRRTS